VRFLIDESLSHATPSIQDRGLKVIQDLSRGTGTVHADRSQCIKAFTCIFQHAVQSMPAGGVLAIRTERDPGSIRILIDRQGPGIPPEDMIRIFDPIHAAGQGGEGIGLLLSRKIIEDHGGTLEVESGLQQGTTYTVELPLIESIQGGMHVGEKTRSGCR
ncbi:MAG: hypothetical protein HZA19_04360, partial [Nitrospirae bacterium]|nr:hypothetical protein [Nitrospirota bacterium]